MKRKLLFALIALFVAIISAQAEATYIDGLYYNLNADTKTAEVTYQYENSSSNSSYVIGDLIIPDTVTYDDIIYSVISIGNYAFFGCDSLTSATIGNSVTSIGDSAFYDCSNLTHVAINSNAIVSKAYNDSSTITSIFGVQVTEYIIGDSVTSIGNYAFFDCDSLTSATIGSSVKSIDEYAFYGCNSLSSIYNYAKNPQDISSNVFGMVNTRTCWLYVPEKSLETYKNAPVWKNFYTIIGINVPDDEDTAVPDVFDQHNTSHTRKVIENGTVYIILPDGRKLNIQGMEVK